MIITTNQVLKLDYHISYNKGQSFWSFQVKFVNSHFQSTSLTITNWTVWATRTFREKLFLILIVDLLLVFCVLGVTVAYKEVENKQVAGDIRIVEIWPGMLKLFHTFLKAC